MDKSVESQSDEGGAEQSREESFDTGSFLRVVAHIADVRPAGVDRDRVGDAIGPFVIRARVGQGGMGVVYAAQDNRDCAQVALKVLPVGLLADPGSAVRFAAEAQALASLDHPAIVRHVAHGTSTGGEPYLAMEWLDGEDLATRLGRARRDPANAGLSVGECVLLARRVTDALAAAHAQGIIHRDIKPSNLFLVGAQVGGVKVLDFGIARIEQAAAVLTATGAIVGTPGYMAPEQARGDRTVDARADIFSLGAVLFECLAGRPAFIGQSPLGILAKLLLEQPRLAELRLDLPAELVSLVDRMLSKDVAQRPQTALDVALELEGIAERFSANRADAVDAAAPTMMALPPPGETGRPSRWMSAEKRFLCVVTAWPVKPASRAADTEGTGSAGASLGSVRRQGAALGLRVEQLVDGSWLATVMGSGNPVDQVTKAARFALLLRRVAPALAIALATGFGELPGAVPVGPVVDKAAELVRAPAGGIRLDDTTAAMLEPRFEVAGTPPELFGEHEFGEGARKLLGRPSPCVGRERELRSLEDILTECIDESVARAVLVTAPAGAGKSRIRHEFLQAVKRRAEGVDVWLGRGDPMRASSPFSLVSSALSTAADFSPGETPAARRQKLSACVERRVGEREKLRVTAFLGEITGTPMDGDACPELAQARRDRQVMAGEIQRAWDDFVAAGCGAGPLLVVLEDMHWADDCSVKLIDTALGKLKDRPFMVLCFARPDIHDRFPKLWPMRGVQEIRLPELRRRAAEKLVRHALGDRADPATVARIVERAAGHAFYLEELIRAVAAGAEEHLPETVLAMVQSRLDALGPEPRRVLRAASIFGEIFWERGVLVLLGGDAGGRSDTHGLIDLLVDREMFARYHDESRFPGEAQLAFRHALLRDGAYAMLTQADLAGGHRLAAEWLEQAGEEDSMVLAEHFDRGGEQARAAAHYLRAAERAFGVADLTASLARAERGLACGAEGDVRMELVRVVGESLAMSGDWARSIPHAEEILRHTRPGSRPFCSALIGKLIAAMQAGRPDDILQGIAHARDLVPTPENAGLVTQVLATLFIVLALTEQGGLAEQHYERMLQAAEVGKHSDPSGLGHVHWARYMRAIHWDADPWTALGAALDQMAEHERMKNPTMTTIARVQLAAIYRILGAYPQAEDLLRQDTGEAGSDGYGAALARCQLAHSLAERGALDEAEFHAKKFVADAQAVGDTSREQTGHMLLVRVHLERGQAGAAQAEASASLKLGVPVPMHHVELLALMAAVHLAQGRIAAALDAARDSIDTMTTIRTRCLQDPFIRWTHVQVLSAAGEHARAGDALRAARDRLLAMAGRIPDESLRGSFLEKVAINARTLALAAERLGPAAG